MSASRTQMMDEVKHVLSRAGFALTDILSPTHGVSFDLLARRDNMLLVLKVLANIDAFSRTLAGQMRLVAALLRGAPLLLGARGSGRAVEDGVAYQRHGVNIISTGSLQEMFLQGFNPAVYSAPGGYYVDLDGELLKRVREELSISLGELAKVAGVTRRTIQMYEEGMNTSVDVGMRLQEFLWQLIEETLIRPLEVLRTPDLDPEELRDLSSVPLEGELPSKIRAMLGERGYDVIHTPRTPFEAVSRSGHTLITGMGSGPRVKEKAQLLNSISRVTEQPSVLFLNASRHRRIGGTPVVTLEDLRKTRDARELDQIISERAS